MFVSILFSYIATIAFAVLFNAPRKTVFPAGLIGAVGWTVYLLMRDYFSYSSPLSIFCGTVVLSLMSELFARIYKQPVTIFAIPGIVPLVPGLPIYQGMYYMIMNAYSIGIEKLIRASLEAGAISLGILLVSGLFRIFTVRHERRFVYSRIKKE
ncbi:MAG: threonine/serine exporter family protein [Acidaminococcaceae bacterium]